MEMEMKWKRNGNWKQKLETGNRNQNATSQLLYSVLANAGVAMVGDEAIISSACVLKQRMDMKTLFGSNAASNQK